MQNQFNNPFSQLILHRFPKNQTLQAWSSADTYLLDYCKDIKHKLLNKNIMVFNDSFGAIGLALSDFEPTIVTDSFLSTQAIIRNCQLNKIDSSKVELLNSLSNFNKTYDYVFIRLPKTLDFLRYFLAKIRPFLHDDSQLVIAAMVKSLPTTTWKLVEEILGETNTSLAKKKARLIFVKPQKYKDHTNFPTQFIQENTKNIIYNHANVFSKQSLDIGTRYLLQNLPAFENIQNIIDLGCGNGIVGLNLAHKYPGAKVIFTDESYMAVASAKLTVTKNTDSIHQHQFIVNNCLDGFEASSVDLIVCNPPFHQSHSIGLHIALQMFQQSYKTLKTQGRFIVIANRHLPYYSHLKRIFGRVYNLASNNKFSIYSMQKN